MSPLKTAGRLAAIVFLGALAACGSNDGATGPMNSLDQTANATGGGNPPGFYTGLWVQNPSTAFVLPDGTRQETVIELSIVQKGASFTGAARQYVSYFFTNGSSTLHIDVGHPGKINGTATATGANIGVQQLGKANYGFFTTLSADKHTLTVNNPVAFGPAAFVR